MDADSYPAPNPLVGWPNPNPRGVMDSSAMWAEQLRRSTVAVAVREKFIWLQVIASSGHGQIGRVTNSVQLWPLIEHQK